MAYLQAVNSYRPPRSYVEEDRKDENHGGTRSVLQLTIHDHVQRAFHFRAFRPDAVALGSI